MNLNEDLQDLPQWYIDDQIATIQYMENEYSVGNTAISNNHYAIWVNYDAFYEKYLFYVLKNNEGLWILNKEFVKDSDKELKLNTICKERYDFLKLKMKNKIGV